MVLNRLRERLSPLLERVGRAFAATGLSANFWTGVGLAVAFAAAIVYGSFLEYAYILGGILLLVSGFFDMVDGQVARATGRSSKRGAFLDSMFDKIAEVAIFAGLASGGLVAPEIALLGIGMSLLVSYARAKADALNIQIRGVGVGERAERLLIIAIVGMIPGMMPFAVLAVVVISAITVAQRMRYVYGRLD
ncbi:MAG: CDP-alcohol phosphatidyltransferase family protein [Thaumarchaeota archaeon]|nr:CDP-alcohol phosphatidyltransferase family protein [Nitrososphaerota archaeon]